jgi:hypothetical protein
MRLPRGRRLTRVIAVLALAAVVIAGVGWWATTAQVPSDAAASPAATMRLTAEQAAAVAATLPTTIAASACLPRIQRSVGWLDLCWQIGRVPDGDPLKDYYWGRLTGTMQGKDTFSGLHWAVLRAGPVASSTMEIDDAWPGQSYDGGCGQVPVTGPITMTGVSMAVDACDRTTVDDSGFATGTVSLTWVCTHCLLPVPGSRGIGLAFWVDVPQGVVPAWDLYADIG